MKRLLALLLVLGLVCSMLPMISAAKETDSDDIWETISEIENEKIRPKRGKSVTAEDYAAIVDDVIAAVEASDSYKEGTIERHGSFFFWETLDGEPNGYSPKLRARMRNGAIADADPEACSGIETISYATRNAPNAVNVAVFQPYYGLDDSFTAQYKTEGESVAKATGGTCTTYRTTNATIDAIADALESCAVVYFDSHGDTDYENYYDENDYVSEANTSYILLQTNSGLTTADQAKVTGTYGTYYHAYYAGSDGSMRCYCVDGTAIANHMEKSAPNNMLWMAICLGMATDGLNAPLRNKGVGVVYGYSQSVTFYGDYFWEENFWNGMKNGKTVSSAISTMKTTCGSWDYSKELYDHNGWSKDSDMCSTITQARNNYAAFPIVVSAEDTYPGHGNVDNLQTVKSTWTLKGSVTPTYTFTAQSNNTAYGTVSVSGNVITPSPKTGYEVSGYTVTPNGAATVTKSGTNYVVSNLTANCTITINFTQKTSYTVSFSVPTGVTCAAQSCYAGSSITLPTPTGKPSAMNNAIFSGWSTASVSKTQTKPTGLFAAGSSYAPQNNVTLYAVYSYTENGKTYYATNPTACTHTSTKTEHKDATCTESGYDRTVCKDCGAVISQSVINALGHNYQNSVIAPTCTEKGYALHTCLRCGNSYKDSYTAALGHDFGEWTVTTEATCTKDGKESRTCARCNFVETQVIPAVGHEYQDGVCIHCGAKDPNNKPDPIHCNGGKNCPSRLFSDLDPKQWYHEGIDYAIENDLMNGVDFRRFDPNGSLTRAMLVTILYRMENEPYVNWKENPFDDVPYGAWYTNAVIWAAREGIVNGISETEFAPDEYITREQIAAILYRYAGSPRVHGNLRYFIDNYSISEYAYDAMVWAVDKEIINGSNKMLCPKDDATRAQIANILYRYIVNE